MPTRLAGIRALERADLPAMAELFELCLGSGVRQASPCVVEFFTRTIFDNPWADPELPSLVAVDERGRPIGFMAGEVRRLRFGEQSVRSVWGAHLVVEPAARRLGVGAVLLRRMLNGAQDLTVTESGSQLVKRMWQTLGGDPLQLEGIYWVRVFRPWRTSLELRMHPRERMWAAARRLAAALDAPSALAAGRYLDPGPVSDVAVELTPAGLLEFWPSIVRGVALYGNYDEAFLSWLFTELAGAKHRGKLIARMVHDTAGRPLGSYVYYLRPGWRSEVLQVAAPKRDLGRVFDHLLSHAHRHGSAAVGGRLSPNLVEPILHRRCLLLHRGGMLAHSRDPEPLCALRSPQALFTGLEGDWYGEAPDQAS